SKGTATDDLGTAPATIALLIGGLAGMCLLSPARAADSKPTPLTDSNAESVAQEIRIEDKFAFGAAKIRWQAEKGQALPLLQSPAVLPLLTFPPRSLHLVRTSDASASAQRLIAKESGTFEIQLEYQLQIVKGPAESGLDLPLRGGLINRVKVTV